MTVELWDSVPDVAAAWRSPEEIKYVVLHHSDTDSGNVETFRRYHMKEFGWADVGYHYVIGNGKGAGDGEAQTGRPELLTGAHAIPRNTDSIGICLVGDFTKSKPTSAQLLSLYELIKSLIRKYPIVPDRILGHKEVDATDCPGSLDVAAIRTALSRPPEPQKDYVGHMHEAVIREALSLDILHGYPDGNFGPDNPTTRGEFAAGLVNLYHKIMKDLGRE